MYKINDIISKCRENEFKTEELDQIMESYHLMTDKFGESTEYHAQSSMHYLNVAGIIADLNADSTSIIAAILHGFTSKEDIELVREKYGDDIANIIDNLEKISHLKLTDYSVSGSNNLKKLLVGLSEDVRVLIIKLADRLDVMRHAYILSPEEQKQKANATMEVYVPVVHRLGINSIKSELENLCLKYTKPDMYEEIEHKLNGSTEELAKSLNEMKESISDILTEHGIKFEIKARVKSIYSIYHKLTTGHKWNEIYDILAMRLIVPTEEDCYLAIGLIHAKYRPVPKRFKDYIAMPKENMYQSLHTTIFGVGGELYEIQIRTYEMDKIAEYGIASHWSYKEHIDGSSAIKNVMEQKLQMFRNIIESSKDEALTDEDFVNTVKKEALDNNIYVYTPKGDVIELPIGSTPIDFAYKVHTNIGDKMVGAIVNDNIVSLDYKLKEGDIVKINVNKNSKGPSKEWINIVNTSQARNRIKSFYTKIDKTENIKHGEELLLKELRKANIPFKEFNEKVNDILDEIGEENINDLYLCIGNGKYTPIYIVNLLSKEEKSKEEIILNKLNNANIVEDLKNDVIVGGLDEIKVTLANCCKPVKGDDVIGYITKGNGVVVHRTNCHNISDIDERIVPTSWNMNSNNKYKTSIMIKTAKKDNMLVNIISKASSSNVTIQSINVINNLDYLTYDLLVLVENVDKLNSFLNDLYQMPEVIEVERVIK